MKKEKIDASEILAEGRVRQGLEKVNDIEAAYLEKDGRISIIPKKCV